MRGILLAGAIALGVPHLAASELVTVEEAGIRALLPGKTASITVPLENSLDRAVQGTLAVSWAGPDNKWSSPALLDVEIPRGKSGHTLPLELEADAWTRLRYTLTPLGESAISFQQRSGVVALAQVSPDVFEVKLSLPESQHLSGPVRAHAVAQHPATLLPLDGIEWSAEIGIGEKRLAGAVIRPIGNGFVELSFEIPPESGGENLHAQLTVHARRGGFAAHAEAPVVLLNRAQGQIQTDKPLYKPGQTIRWRAVLTTAGGKAAAGMKAVVRISSAQGDLSHSVETTASRHGIVHGEWKVPDGAEPDDFTIGVRHSEDGDNLLASHRVKVSRYELPAFTVSVTPGQTFYLPGQSANITVSAAYLFGKPVTGGRVRIQKDDQLLAEGTTAAAGTFTAVLSLADAAPLGHQDFRDTTLAAFVTDPASGRTEQRKATVRVSRKPIHLYVAASRGPAIYISASHADGRPAALPVEVQAGQHLVRVQTNRYGVAKAVFPGLAAGRTPVELRARDSAGGTISAQKVIRVEKAGMTLEADRSLHRGGEAVRLALHTVSGAPTAVLVRAITAKGVVASRAVQMDRGSGEVTFPYQPEFSGRVVFVAWAGEAPGGQATAGTIYPDGSGGLQLTAAADRPEYAPGGEGTISLSARTADGRAADAAFGIAIVDQAVHERSRTDQEFGRRPVFSCAWCGDEGEGEIGGVRINDLIFRGDGPVTPELDLVAEALLARRGFSSWEFWNSKSGEPPEFTSVKDTMEEWNRRLEAHYRATLEFPRDLGSFVSILRDSWLRAEDPWQQPYTAEFGFSGPRVQARVISASRDKKPGTRDDLPVRTFEWRYFLPYERIIGDILRQQVDYPATPAGLLAVLRRGGLDLTALRDPWGKPYEVQVVTQGSHRLIGIRSPGEWGP